MTKLPVIPSNIKGKRVLLRVDFNLPMQRSRILDQSRLLKTLPTIDLLKKRGAKVVLMTHLEVSGQNPSNRPLLRIIKKYFKDASFAGGIIGPKVQNKIRALKPGGVILLENLRLDKGEKNNSSEFARKLSLLGDIYVNEAFSASHRAHASITGVPKFLPSFAGLLFKEEVRNLSRSFSPPRPFLAVVGGNKLSTKADLLKKILKKADRVVVGSALVPHFFFARDKKLRSPKMFLPVDVIVRRNGRKTALDVDLLKKSDSVYDLGPQTMRKVLGFVRKSRFVLWNGPLGWLEGGFEESSRALAKALARSKAEVVVGGGDTLAFLNRQKLVKKFAFVSTGGGAALEYMAKGTLPGIEAIKRAQKHV